MNLDSIIEKWGVHKPFLIDLVNALFSILIAGLIGIIVYITAKKFLPKLIKKIAGAAHIHWSTWLLDQRFFNRLAFLFFPIVLSSGVSSIEWEYVYVINRILEVWITVACALLVISFMKGINRVYENMSDTRDKPVKIITQVITVLIWCTVILILISIFTRKSLTVLIGGLTAFAAVLLLVFQDTILGFVAGIQLSSNNMLRIKDWIVMPGRGVDGEVIEIGLTTVKVQNWDQTITTVPTHKLVSESFTNWRGMLESGGRRIKRSVNIDVMSIGYLSESALTAMYESEILHKYMQQRFGSVEDLKNYSQHNQIINIGLFREYMETWLSGDADINRKMTYMVRQLQPEATGLPLEIYCFSKQQSLIEYENVQSRIFEHIYAVMPMFGLKAFEYLGNLTGGLSIK